MSRYGYPPMNYARREEIFAKEVLTCRDIGELFDCSEAAASLRIKEIKIQVGDRLGMQGRLHIQDYLNWLQLDKDCCRDRYVRPEDLELAKKLEREAISKQSTSVFTTPSDKIRQIHAKGKSL